MTRKTAIANAIDFMEGSALTPSVVSDTLATLKEMIASMDKAAERAAERRANAPRESKISEVTTNRINALSKVLNGTAKTGDELAVEAGLACSALQVANAVKFIPGVEKVKVVRQVIGKNGLSREVEKTAYVLQ